MPYIYCRRLEVSIEVQHFIIIIAVFPQRGHLLSHLHCVAHAVSLTLHLSRAALASHRASVVNVVSSRHTLWIVLEEGHVVGSNSALPRTSTISPCLSTWARSTRVVMVIGLAIGHHLLKRYALQELVRMLLLLPLILII